LLRGQRLAEGLWHHALAVRLAVGRPRHDVGVGIDDRLADVARSVLRAAVVVTLTDDARGLGGDVAEIGTDVAAGPRAADVVARRARLRLVELGAARGVAARRARALPQGAAPDADDAERGRDDGKSHEPDHPTTVHTHPSPTASR